MTLTNPMTGSIRDIRSEPGGMIVLAFALLPVTDTLNGLLPRLPIGVAYKLLLTFLLLLQLLITRKSLRKDSLLILFAVACYLIFSVGINVLALGRKPISMDFPVKLFGNVLLLVLLRDSLLSEIISQEGLERIMTGCAFFLAACFLVPFALGLGSRVYHGDMGYKAFFISQNELSMVIVTLTFFVSFMLTRQMTFGKVVLLLALFFCGVLLNTKSTLIACLLAVACWIIPVLLKSSVRVKIVAFFTFVGGAVLLRRKLFSAIAASADRMNGLMNKFYDGSVLSGILSGRNRFLEEAFARFKSDGHGWQLLFGNGFCSDFLIEMDLFDLFFYLGLFGIGTVIIFLGRVLVLSLFRVKSEKTIIRPFSFALMIVMLFLAGHVLFMSMAGFYFVLYLCFLLYCRYDKKEVEKEEEPGDSEVD